MTLNSPVNSIKLHP